MLSEYLLALINHVLEVFPSKEWLLKFLLNKEIQVDFVEMN
jgi:hypothetical protein